MDALALRAINLRKLPVDRYQNQANNQKMIKVLTLILIIIALSACASYSPTDFQNVDQSKTQDQYKLAFEECADIAKNVNISDPEAIKIAKAGVGAAGGYVAGGAISFGTVIATGASSTVAMPVVLLGVIGGSIWGANAATSEQKERDTVLVSCLQTKGYRVSK